jgi:glutathione S-transferase
MGIELYDLAAAEDTRRLSPTCWHMTVALAHKGLAAKSIPWRFTEKDVIAFSGQDPVPVLVDGIHIVSDSWRIALYLDEAYPAAPELMDSEHARGAILAFKNWRERYVHAATFCVAILDLFSHLHPKDKRYFRESRKTGPGKTLEALGSDHSGSLAALSEALKSVRPVLADQAFIGATHRALPTLFYSAPSNGPA